MRKFFVVTRADMSPGDQLAQSVHVAIDLAARSALTVGDDKFHTWHKGSNTVVCLAVDNEKQLGRLCEQLLTDDIEFICFREPDMKDELTAVAFIASGDYKVRKSRLSPR